VNCDSPMNRFLGAVALAVFCLAQAGAARIQELRFSKLDAWNVRFSRVEKDARSGRVDSSLLF